MGSRPPRDRPRLALATGAVALESDDRSQGVTAADLVGVDLTRVPQELAPHVPGRGSAWPRGTCLPAVDTPDGPRALCFGTADELRPLVTQWRGGAPINSARTLWVVSVRR